MTLRALDIFFILLLFAFSIVCCFKGFINSVLGKVAFLAGLVCAFLFNDKFSFIFSKYISSKYIVIGLTGICIFIIVFIIIKIIQQVLDNLFSGKILKSLDRALGFFIGLIFGLLIIALILKILEMLKNDLVSGLLNDSYFYYVFRLINARFLNNASVINSEANEAMLPGNNFFNHLFCFMNCKGLYHV
jgi:membrane protein required for colicin V production